MPATNLSRARSPLAAPQLQPAVQRPPLPPLFLHTSAYVSIRQHTSKAYVSIKSASRSASAQHTSAYVSIRLSIRQHKSASRSASAPHTSAYVSIRQHTSAYVSIRQHTSASRSASAPYKGHLCRLYFCIRQHTSASRSA
jgi:hypothetical protein